MGSGEAAAAREALVTRVRPLAAQLLVLLHGGGGIMIYTDIMNNTDIHVWLGMESG